MDSTGLAIILFVGDDHIANVRTLQSIYHQTNEMFQLIICNDDTKNFQAERLMYNFEENKPENISKIYFHENRYPIGEKKSMYDLMPCWVKDNLIMVFDSRWSFVQSGSLHYAMEIFRRNEEQILFIKGVPHEGALIISSAIMDRLLLDSDKDITDSLLDYVRVCAKNQKLPFTECDLQDVFQINSKKRILLFEVVKYPAGIITSIEDLWKYRHAKWKIGGNSISCEYIDVFRCSRKKPVLFFCVLLVLLALANFCVFYTGGYHVSAIVIILSVFMFIVLIWTVLMVISHLIFNKNSGWFHYE